MKVTSNINIGYEVSCFDKVYKYSLEWDREKVKEDSYIAIEWSVPMSDFLYRWYPNCFTNRNIIPTWGYDIKSSIASGAPVVCIFNQHGKSKYTCAVSEFKKAVLMNFGVNEKTANLDCLVKLPLMQFTNSNSTELQIRIDDEEKDIEKAISEVSVWWEEFTGVMHIPENVTDTFYSFWYSYHQEVYPENVEKECELVAKYGIKTVIVDDGWQTYDNAGMYAYCGDWQPLKIPNMAEHVGKIHKLGLKYILWFSVPFIGIKSQNYEQFKDKLLYVNKGLHAGILDPRYSEVREYLINIYRKAVSDWNLDGLKLDFIDAFNNPDNIPANEDMDIKDLHDAIYKLMTDIKCELTKLNPQIMIEFRQQYIGPAMRSYGNFFRAADCPYDLTLNRVSVIDLRLLSGSTPVHSDMLMWHNNETPENCALQIINVLFSVIQLSVKLAEQSEKQKKVIQFWLDFAKKNKKLLQGSELKVHDPQNLYTAVEGIGDNEKISVIYTPNKSIIIDKDTTTVINGTQKGSIILEFLNDSEYQYEILDCMGGKIQESTINGSGLCRVCVPEGGMIIIK